MECIHCGNIFEKKDMESMYPHVSYNDLHCLWCQREILEDAVDQIEGELRDVDCNIIKFEELQKLLDSSPK